MRAAEIDKWIKEGGDLPEDLTKEEKEYLEELGWETSEKWFENGQKRYVYNYLNGQRHGKWEGWYKNGQKHYEKSFIHGMRHDTVKKWRHDGHISLHIEYYYGNKIE